MLCKTSAILTPLLSLQGYPPQSYYAVFDGHVAVEAAEYASVHLLPNLVRHPDFLADPVSALRGAILTTDQHFCKIVSPSHTHSHSFSSPPPLSLSLSLSLSQNQRAGSTAVVALLRGSTLHVAWVGDSQAMLFRRGQGVELVDPHKPDREVSTHTHTLTH